MGRKIQGIGLAVAALFVLSGVLASDADAAWLYSGYPCRVAYWPAGIANAAGAGEGTGGQHGAVKFQLWTQPNCGGTQVSPPSSGFRTYYVLSLGATASGVRAEVLYPQAPMLELYGLLRDSAQKPAKVRCSVENLSGTNAVQVRLCEAGVP